MKTQKITFEYICSLPQSHPLVIEWNENVRSWKGWAKN